MRTFRTLCSGGELFGVGACAAGWRHLDGYEIELGIAMVAWQNGFDVRVADVCQIDYAALDPADHLHASPSCKSASQANPHGSETAGDRAVGDGICRAIRAHQGKTFSLENVWRYRKYDSFKCILAALHESGFTVDRRHINAADFGVPQTRKRLILRAVRGGRVPLLNPTHRRGGDMFHTPWVGWYAAIEDMLHTLPETTPARWQQARMPRWLRETLLIGPGGYNGAVVQAKADMPSFTVTDGGNQTQWRAYLVDNQNTSNNSGAGTRRERETGLVTLSTGSRPAAFLMGDQAAGASVGVQIADAGEPAFTVRTYAGGSRPCAYLVGGGNTQLAQVDSHARPADEPAFTVRNGANGSPERAYLIQGHNAGQEWGKGYRSGDEPSPSVTTSDGRPSHDPIALLPAWERNEQLDDEERTNRDRPIVSGRWVRLTIQSLGRFQTVPDSYIGLTPMINGNGIPCRLGQAMMESLSPVYERSE